MGKRSRTREAEFEEEGLEQGLEGGNGVLSGHRVVVVDDSEAQRRRLRGMFESMGMVCVGEAADGLQAIEVVERQGPDLVSLDVLMPVMHGVETLGYLRASTSLRQPLIVFVTALQNLDSLGAASADAVFSKRDSAETFERVLAGLFLDRGNPLKQSGS